MTFFRSLLRASPAHREPAIPAGHRLYAIGDVHGRDDLLGELLAKVEADSAARAPAQTVIVLLGDLIDRGPGSRDVVERMLNYRPADARLVFLAGNHEEVLLRILAGDEALVADWLKFGGAQCMQSYGVDPVKLKRMGPRRAAEAVRAAIPPEHREFLAGFGDTFRAGDYLFVHAGIRPGVPIEEQSQADLRWIREPFLTYDGDDGFTVVHGHTICDRVEDRPNRIGIDTGAYRSGVLTAIGIQNDERWFLQTGESSVSVQIGTAAVDSQA